MMFKSVDNGPIEGLPQSLVCGECGTSTHLIDWHSFADDEGCVRGIVGHAKCPECRRSIVGMLANDPADMATLRQAVVESLLDS